MCTWCRRSRCNAVMRLRLEGFKTKYAMALRSTSSEVLSLDPLGGIAGYGIRLWVQTQQLAKSSIAGSGSTFHC